ncbi:hypothetical protein [Desulfococcus sp.]|uniref:hypothetical protein n=1 Tax=Desulfococcus sp. TaxID=2025834 RepID=UPI003593464D
MDIIPMQGWQIFIDEGDRYLKTAMNGSRRRPRVFTPEILYNLIAMAIEKHAMGYLMYHHQLPDNHTLRDLMDALRKVGDLNEDLYGRVVDMDRFQEICSVFQYRRDIPEAADVATFMDIGGEVSAFVRNRLFPSS